MQFSTAGFVVKISVSNMLLSQSFYTEILGFTVDDDYTINSGNNFGDQSYMQLYLDDSSGNMIMIGLYKDIESPFVPLPQTGTVPSFLVNDINATLQYLQSQNVVIDTIDGSIIISNTSDKGFTDEFFFFRDPDNNSLVIRENMK